MSRTDPQRRLKIEYEFLADLELKLHNENFAHTIRIFTGGTEMGVIAILEGLANGDFDKSRLKFSESAMLKYCKATKLNFVLDDDKPMYNRIMFDAIFSNNHEIISKLDNSSLLGLRVDYDPDAGKDISEYKIHPLLDQNHQFESFMQNLLFYDGDGLEKNKEILLGYKQTRKSKWKGYDDWTIDMINAYQSKDIDAISKLTNKRADMRKKWEANDWYGKSYFGTAFAKLAVMNGYDIKIESPYIVKELLDTTPLDSYETYDWLEVLYHEGYDAYVEKFVKPHQNKNKGGFLNKLFSKN